MTMLTRWAAARTISESSGTTDEADNEDLAKLRFLRWKQLPVFRQGYRSEDAALSPLEITATQLRNLIGGEARDVHPRGATPPWVETFDRWWENGSLLDQSAERDLGLLEVIFPLVAGARAELLGALQTKEERTDGENSAAVSSLIASLADNPPFDELSNVVVPTMILELNVAREEGTLDGDDGASRYADFVRSLRSSEFKAKLLNEYAPMTRLVVTRLTFWLERSTELAERFVNDIDDIRTVLLDGVTPTRVSAAFGKGDSHNRGRSVAVLTTDIGHVVYKPRSASIDLAFDRILAWHADRGAEFPLRSPRHVARATHGWFEHVDGTEPTDESGADRFAWRIGALTALMHFLQATDFHFENIIAVGEHPIAVDLETLLHTDKLGSAPVDSTVSNVGAEILRDSVYSIGILPTKIFAGDGADMRSVDISAIGGAGGQETIVDVPKVESVGTDTMHLARSRSIIEAQLNRPAATQGAPHDLLTRHREYARGFEWTYRQVMAAREDWTRPGGLIDGFQSARSRLVMRPTMVYARLLIESYHPDFLRDAIDRDMCLSKLLIGYYGQDRRDSMIAAELEDVRDGDVPMFLVEVSTGEVIHASSGRRVDRLRVAPIDAVRQLVATQAGETDLSAQLQIIATSFDSASEGMVTGLGAPQLQMEEPEPITRSDKLSAAEEIATRLLEMSVGRDKRRGWIGLSFVGEKWWSVTASGTDLYSGLPGVAVSLSTVGRATRNEVLEGEGRALFDDLADVALSFHDVDDETLKSSLPKSVDAGGFGAASGLAYSLCLAHSMYSQPRYAEAVEALMRPIAAVIDRDLNYDMVGGSAGALMVALAIAEAVPQIDASDVIARAVERLASGAIELGDAIAWPRAEGGVSLVGLSHGTLGVAVALNRVATWDPTYRASVAPLIEGALNYERRHYAPDSGDWEDLRPESAGASSPMRAWCHGSAGGILGRSELASTGEWARDARLIEEISAGLGATVKSTEFRTAAPYGQGNHSLCHGDVGNLICSDRAIRTLGGFGEISIENERSWAAIVRSGTRDGWRCSSPAAVATSGLMGGLAGIAWGLAHSAAPESVPNVLLLEPFRGRQAIVGADN